MFGLFKRGREKTDVKLEKLAILLSEMLQLQKLMAGTMPIIAKNGNINKKALGYSYGFVDAGLRMAGYDMSNLSIGIPVMFQVLRHTFPGDEEKLMDFIIHNIGSDKDTMLGAMKGGQQYLDYANKRVPGIAGLARYLLGEE